MLNLSETSQGGITGRVGGKSSTFRGRSNKLDSLTKVLAALDTQPLALFYLNHFLNTLEAQGSCEAMLIGTKFGPALSDPEQGFTRILEDVLLLYKAQIEGRIRGAVNGS
jgi:hypothetical protein